MSRDPKKEEIKSLLPPSVYLKWRTKITHTRAHDQSRQAQRAAEVREAAEEEAELAYPADPPRPPSTGRKRREATEHHLSSTRVRNANGSH